MNTSHWSGGDNYQCPRGCCVWVPWDQGGSTSATHRQAKRFGAGAFCLWDGVRRHPRRYADEWLVLLLIDGGRVQGRTRLELCAFCASATLSLARDAVRVEFNASVDYTDPKFKSYVGEARQNIYKGSRCESCARLLSAQLTQVC